MITPTWNGLLGLPPQEFLDELVTSVVAATAKERAFVVEPPSLAAFEDALRRTRKLVARRAELVECLDGLLEQAERLVACLEADEDDAAAITALKVAANAARGAAP